MCVDKGQHEVMCADSKFSSSDGSIVMVLILIKFHASHLLPIHVRLLELCFFRKA